MSRQTPATVAVEIPEAVQPPGARLARVPHETLVALAAFAVAWQVASAVLPPYVVPSWERIWAALQGLRYEFVVVTAGRVLLALVVSFVGGIALAVAMFQWRVLDRYLMPLVRLVMAVPVVCWILFSVLWFRGVELRIAFVLVVVCAPIFLIDVLDAMQGVPRELRDMLRSFRPTPVQYFSKLILPATLPAILTSWKINLSLAIRVVTMAELVGATSGIGYGLVIAQELFSVADVFAWTVVLVVMLMATQVVVGGVERRVLVWRD
ncbi:MAG: ABC transporter permease subunit [Armatimonadota bacterium]|nr:ABC transporter permease subunit [Armatimonadota bacterium]MDR5698185.1 ABC transporter permease subunit [Armatimonadota bacterium]